MALLIFAFGVLGFGALFVATHRQTVVDVLVWGGLGCAFLVPHWLLLGRPTAAAMNCVFLLSSIIGVCAARKLISRRVYWVVYPLALALGWMGATGWLDAVAIVATIAGLAACQSTELANLRRGMILSNAVWAVFGALSGSLPRVVFSTVQVGGHGLHLWRGRKTPAPLLAPAAA